MDKTREEFINECIKNRNYFAYSVEDVCGCLSGVSVKDYMDFECGKWNMNDENIQRLSSILGVSKPAEFNIHQYIDTAGLNKEDIASLEDIVRAIKDPNGF